jgi:F-type H+-transporting ATPase subunit beta
MSQQVNGHVVQVIGPVVDVEFPDQHLPAILNAVKIVDDGTMGVVPIDVTCEVAQHLGENRARCIAMEPTEGMVRGMVVTDLGEPISVPVGKQTLGRVLGTEGVQSRPISGCRSTAKRRRWSSNPPKAKCSKPVSRSLICLSPTPKAARPASLAAPVLARPSSSWS